MSVILRNDFGAVAVNKGVLERMIIEDMLAMSDVLLLCNKKGKPIKDKPAPFIDPDYYDAVDVSEKKGRVTVKVVQPSLQSTETVPLCSWATRRTMASPMPLPLAERDASA